MMDKYLGVKMVHAAPALRLDDGKGDVRIQLLKSCPMPRPGDAVDMGYKVVYEDGYESWSPQDVFEKAYRKVAGMNFGLALEAAKMGKKIARAGWNGHGKGMYVFLANEDISFTTDANLREFLDEEVTVHGMMVMRTAQKTLAPGWLASQADMLAEDWYVVEDEDGTV